MSLEDLLKPEAISFISAIVAIVSAILAVSQARSAKRSAKAAEEQVQIAKEALELQKKKEQQEEIKSKQANIVLKRNGEYLIIENKGDAPAKNVKLTIIEGNTDAFLFLKKNYEIPQNDSISEKLVLHKSSQPPWTIKITWDDEYQKGNEKIQQLN